MKTLAYSIVALNQSLFQEESAKFRVCLQQAEVRRMLPEDVWGARDGLIWCRGKERDEFAPILPETLELLKLLAEKGKPGVPIFQGERGAFKEDGMRKLWLRLYERAGIQAFTGHDLRRTFGTLVRRASGDEFMSMRLLRDKIPGQNDRYIAVRPEELRRALWLYSPLRQARGLAEDWSVPHSDGDGRRAH